MDGNGLDSKSICNSNLMLEFDKYEKQGRRDKKILQFAITPNQRFTFPLFYEVSLIVLAVPTAQVSVERSFSGFKFVKLSPQRCQLNSKLIDDIVLIRLKSRRLKKKSHHLTLRRFGWFDSLGCWAF